MKSKTTLGQFGLLGLLFIYPMFGQIVPEIFGLGSFFVSSGIILLRFLTSQDWSRLKPSFSAVIWLLLACYAAASHFLLTNNGRDDSIIFLAVVFLVLVSTFDDKWIAGAINVILVYSSIHVLSTILFYLSPDIYLNQFKPTFFPSSPGAIGYQSGLSIHYTYNGTYCAIGFMILSIKALIGKYSPFGRILLWTCSATFFFALILTTKRAHLLFAVLSILVTYLFLGQRWKYFGIVTMLGLGYLTLSILAVTSSGVSDSLSRISETFMEDDLISATSGRTYLWETAIEGWKESPFFGNGWSSFFYRWPGSDRTAVLAHNEILNLLFESGVIGLLLFLIAIISTFTIVIRTLRYSQEISQVQLLAMAISLTLQLFFVSYAVTTGGLLTDPFVFSIYFVFVAVTLSIPESNRQASLRLAKVKV